MELGLGTRTGKPAACSAWIVAQVILMMRGHTCAHSLRQENEKRNLVTGPENHAAYMKLGPDNVFRFFFYSSPATIQVTFFVCKSVSHSSGAGVSLMTISTSFRSATLHKVLIPILE